MVKSNYDKYPALAVSASGEACVAGWDAIADRLHRALAERGRKKLVVTVECYTGVDETEVLEQLRSRLVPALAIDVRQCLLPPAKVDALVAPFLGGDDPVFGFLSGLTLPQFFDPAALGRWGAALEGVEEGLVLVVGCGARLIAEGDILVYADLARWEAQNRFRRNTACNLGAEGQALSAGLRYKRAFFVDWRVCDRWKRPLIRKWDFVLDTHNPAEPKLAEGEAVRRGLRSAVTRPFRVVPFFDPAPWGGQWMKECAPRSRSQELRLVF